VAHKKFWEAIAPKFHPVATGLNPAAVF